MAPPLVQATTEKYEFRPLMFSPIDAAVNATVGIVAGISGTLELLSYEGVQTGGHDSRYLCTPCKPI